MPPLSFKGIIFDLDGPLVTTKAWHYAAWKRLVEEVLQEAHIAGIFTEDHDNLFTAGIPKFHGVIRALKHFGVPQFMCLGDYYIDPRKDPSAYAALSEDRKRSNDRARQLADKKQAYFQEIVIEKGKTLNPMPGVIALLDDMRAHGLRAGVATGYQAPEELLTLAGILDRFEALVCSRDEGTVSARLGKKILGKAGTYEECAARLGLAPEECIGVDDGLSGIKAVKSLGMKAVGVALSEDEYRLIAPECDVTVRSLEEISVSRLEQLFHA